jgi:hypothetical protein
MEAKESIDVGSLIGQHRDDVAEQLQRAGVTANVVSHDLPGPIAMLFQLRPTPKIVAGDHVDVIASGNRVVGFNVDYGAVFADLRDRVANLEQQIGGKG